MSQKSRVFYLVQTNWRRLLKQTVEIVDRLAHTSESMLQLESGSRSNIIGTVTKESNPFHF